MAAWADYVVGVERMVGVWEHNLVILPVIGTYSIELIQKYIIRKETVQVATARSTTYGTLSLLGVIQFQTCHVDQFYAGP